MACEQGGRLVVVRTQEAAATGAGTASTTASAVDRLRRRSRRSIRPRPARGGRPEPTAATSTPRSRRAVASACDQRRHAALERPEERRPVGVRRRDLGTERPHEAAAALGAARSGGNTAAADMSSTEPAWMPPIRGSTSVSTTRWPELARHQGPDGAVADGAADVGPRAAAASRARPSAPREAEDAAASRRPEPGRDAQRVPVGQRAQPPPGPHRRAAGGDRHQRVAEADLAAQLDRLGPAPEEAVGAHVDDAPAEGRRCATGRRGAASLEHDDLGRVAPALGPPVSSQAAASPLMPPPTTTTRPAPCQWRRRPRSRRRPGRR